MGDSWRDLPPPSSLLGVVSWLVWADKRDGGGKSGQPSSSPQPSPSPAPPSSAVAAGSEPAPGPAAPSWSPEDSAALTAALGLDLPAGGGLPYGSTLGGEAQVLMGYETARQRVRQPRTGPAMSGLAWADVPVPQTQDLTAALNLIYTDPAERKRIADRLVSAGMIPPDWTDAQLASAWSNAVKTSSDLLAQGTPMTPFEIIAMQGRAPGGGGEGMKPRTIVNKQYNLSTPDEARAVLNSLFSQALGRRASESEIDDFLAQLNAAQRANPSITTSHYSASGDNVSSSTSGGVNPSEFGQSYLDREFGSEQSDYQVISDLMPAFFQSLQTGL